MNTTPDGPADPTRCGLSERCVDFHRMEKRGAPRALDTTICNSCIRRYRLDIGALGRDYIELELCLPRSAGRLGDRRTYSAGTTIPLLTSVDALQRAIVAGLGCWVGALDSTAQRGSEAVSPAGRTRPGWAVSRAIERLVPAVPTLARLPSMPVYVDGPGYPAVTRSGLDGLTQLGALHRASLTLTGRTRLVSRLPGECSRCGAAMLDRAAGSDTVRCGQCGRTWTYADYHRYVGMLLADIRVQSTTPDRVTGR